MTDHGSSPEAAAEAILSLLRSRGVVADLGSYRASGSSATPDGAG